jgi:hypothetical protein
MQSVREYFSELLLRFGQGWNRFWYTASDPFALSVIRIATGLVALYCLLTFTPDLTLFFKDGGLLPTELVAEFSGNDALNVATLSYLSYLHTPTELYVAHVIGAIVLLLFTAGFYTRITSVLALIVTLAYVHRAPFVTSDIETALAMLQFYLCFGPCGAYLSVDRWMAKREAASDKVDATDSSVKTFGATISLRLIQLHVCVFCLMSGLAKLTGPAQLMEVENWVNPWLGGFATWQMIGRQVSPMIDLTFLRATPGLVQAWAHLIVAFELVFPFLIWKNLARPLLLGVAVFMWGTLALISGAAVFSMLMIVANFAFFSPQFLRGIFQKREKAPAEQAVTSPTATATV